MQTSATGNPGEANVRQRPFWNAGALFFTDAKGNNYRCSAQFVGSNKTLLTAAHCLRDSKTGEWYKNFKFVQAYKNGGGSTSFTTTCQTVKSNWVTGRERINFSKDYGFLVTKGKSDAGWMGFKTKIPYSVLTAIGYPINYGSGRVLQRVSGTVGEVTSTLVRLDNNPMTSGSSGGAWIAESNHNNTSGNYVVGLNSFGLTETPTKVYSPYFDSHFYSLYYSCKRHMW
ncbi:hypothetical protein EHW64_01425 [Erwinia psidii]|uniref:trypsin-like serine peptidase n=1 Tax=Erwinia psidii TaxID=69224 RepID=UPI00226B879E|nr:trypsin-like peptidase domain-containing protein [Erwinia psidii]MCX8959879.1 hypothetical protein [Erwinia psidii]